jgi:YkoY family integral membrane protein
MTGRGREFKIGFLQKKDMTGQDIAVILMIALLEGFLSVDNALVLALIARNLPRHQQKRALTYGLAGAVAFRLIALWLITRIIQLTWIKFVGGGYLLWLSASHLLRPAKSGHARKQATSFWKAVVVIELTDIIFALDSIVAAVAMSDKFWVVFAGGVIGIFMMRLASGAFINLLRKFPAFETAAYLMVAVVGIKLLLTGFHLPWLDFDSASSPAFWLFWGSLVACILSGFRKKPARDNA